MLLNELSLEFATKVLHGYHEMKLVQSLLLPSPISTITDYQKIRQKNYVHSKSSLLYLGIPGFFVYEVHLKYQTGMVVSFVTLEKVIETFQSSDN